MTPVEIAALLDAVVLVGRIAAQALGQLKSAGLTDEDIAHAWIQVQARLRQAETLWQHDPAPAREGHAPASS